MSLPRTYFFFGAGGEWRPVPLYSVGADILGVSHITFSLITLQLLWISALYTLFVKRTSVAMLVVTGLLYVLHILNSHLGLPALSQLIPIQLFLFAASLKMNRSDFQRTGQVAIAIIWGAAAIHKINSSFLNGDEFRPGGVLYSISYSHTHDWPAVASLLGTISQSTATMWLIVTIELLFGILFYLSKPIAVWLNLLFFAGISLFSPLTGNIAFYFFPLHFMAFPRLHLRARTFAKRRPLWAGVGLVIYLTSFSSPYIGHLAAFNFIATLLWIATIVVLMLNDKSVFNSTTRHFRHTVNIRTTIIGFAIAVYGALPFLITVPQPLSFSMFSGIKPLAFSANIQSETPIALPPSGAWYNFTQEYDTRNGRYRIASPTASARNFIVRHICSRRNAGQTVLNIESTISTCEEWNY